MIVRGFVVCLMAGAQAHQLLIGLQPTYKPSILRLCIEVKDLTHPGLRPRPKGLRVFTRVRPTGSLQITAILRIKIIVDYDKYTVSSTNVLS